MGDEPNLPQDDLEDENPDDDGIDEIPDHMIMRHHEAELEEAELSMPEEPDEGGDSDEDGEESD